MDVVEWLLVECIVRPMVAPGVDIELDRQTMNRCYSVYAVYCIVHKLLVTTMHEV